MSDPKRASQHDKARERRTDKRVDDVALGKKKASDALIEEAAEEAFDWLERGGVRRILTVLKICLLLLLVSATAIVLYVLQMAD